MRNINDPWTGDPDYHFRHGGRSLRRARRIAQFLPLQCTFLDVGCNQGLTSKYLLNSGRVRHATGIELAADAVSADLKTDERFSLVQGDICDLVLDKRYDAIFYGAVHHHIVRERGFGTAVSVLQQLVMHTDRCLFFETGHVSEGGRWGWQNVLRKHFRTDEEHFSYLLQTIEPWLLDFDVIGKFFIHGIRRWLVRVDIKPVEDASRGVYPMQVSDSVQNLAKDSETARMRSCGPPSLLAREVGVTYWESQCAGGSPVFLKRRAHMTHLDRDEYLIGRQLQHDWAVTPRDYQVDKGIAFPWISGKPLSDWNDLDSSIRQLVAERLIKIFKQAMQTTVSPPARLLLPAPANISLLEIVDLNPKNILVCECDMAIALKVVDFERQSNHYLWKNRIHLAMELFRLRSHTGFAAIQLVIGVASGLGVLIKYQFLGVRRRIIDRQPSLASFLVTEVRSVTGRLIVWMFPFLASR
jgi:SAM-dependent methyltransferase